MTRIALFMASAGYLGMVPIAPGTAGSAAGLLIYAAVRLTHSPLVEAVVVLSMLVIGLWSAGVVEQQLGKDPRVVVIDEVLGMLMTLAFLDVNPIGAVIGFLIFRVLDVTKPFPAGRLEHLHGGAGIMLDDAMAGIYGNLVMRALIALAPGLFA
jgi:phosphatidylglycerophosphatase A